MKGDSMTDPIDYDPMDFKSEERVKDAFEKYKAVMDEIEEELLPSEFHNFLNYASNDMKRR